MSRRILIVENEVTEIQKMSDHLRQYEVELFVATKGEHGVEVFFSELPDLLFINLLMPDLSGTDMVNRIRSRIEGAKIPIYFLSPLVSSGSKITKESGATGQIERPINLLEFDSIVRKHFPDLKPPESMAGAYGRPRMAGSDKWRQTSLALMPLPKLFAQIFKSGQDGLLSIELGHRKLKIKFAKGEPAAFSPGELAKFLSRNKYISVEEARKIPRHAKAKKVSGLTALREMNLLTEQKVDRAYRDFIYEVLEEAAGFSEGEIHFKGKKVLEKPTLSGVDFVWMAGLQVYNSSYLMRKFDKEDRLNKKLYLALKTNTYTEPSRPIRSVLDNVGQGRTLDGLVRMTEGVSENQVYHIAYALLLCGVLTFNEAESASPGRNRTQNQGSPKRREVTPTSLD